MKKKLVNNWDCPIPDGECGKHPVCDDCIKNTKNKKEEIIIEDYGIDFGFKPITIKRKK